MSRPSQLRAVKAGSARQMLLQILQSPSRLLGRQVMIMDADFGLSNIDVLFHVEPKHGILQLLTGGLSLQNIVMDGPHGIKILSAGSGVQEIQSLDPWQRLKILEAFDAYENDIDVLLIDTAAGLSENAAFFCSAAQEIVIVTSPEPTSIADCYALDQGAAYQAPGEGVPCTRKLGQGRRRGV